MTVAGIRIKSIREARADFAAYLEGDRSRVKIETISIPEDVDVRAVREKLGLTQAQFASIFGFRLSTVQSWERTKNRRKPTQTARILLTALDRQPEAVFAALTA